MNSAMSTSPLPKISSVPLGLGHTRLELFTRRNENTIKYCIFVILSNPLNPFFSKNCLGKKFACDSYHHQSLSQCLASPDHAHVSQYLLWNTKSGSSSLSGSENKWLTIRHKKRWIHCVHLFFFSLFPKRREISSTHVVEMFQQKGGVVYRNFRFFKWKRPPF